VIILLYYRMNSTLLNSPFVLYLVGLVAVGNLMMFVYAQQFISIGVFIVSVLLMSFFTKNMIAALVVAMVICNIVCAISSQQAIEGFKGGGKFNIPKAIKNIINIRNDVAKIVKKMEA